MTTTVADYVGRRFDVLALRGALPLGEALLSQTLFDTVGSGDVCTGVQKLAQRWAMTFLLQQGSMTFWPDRGTEFMLQAKRGFQSEINVIIEFNIAAVLVGQQLRAEEDDTWNAEDRYDHVVLQHVALLPGTLRLFVEVWSKAGAQRQVILPISIVPIAIGG